MTQSLLILALLCCISTIYAKEETITLSLPVWRLELTIKIQEPFRRNLYGNLRRGLSPLSSTQHGTALQISSVGENRELQTTSDKIDGAIQSTAELHLKNIYAEQFNMEPTQVLLTVVTNTPSNNSNNSQNNQDEELIEYEEVSTNGIYVRSSFLGGVVTFPLGDSPVNNNDSGSERLSLPTRSELQSVTLKAFSIPGKGEIFLQNLKEYTPTITQLNPGLLLISASEVKRNDVADSNAADIATTNSNVYEGSAPAITPANTNNNNGGNDMNIWAVAAVAALGAMFIVIVTCTSILYCDWRKRKERRERRRERAFMQQQQQQQQQGGGMAYVGGGSNYARSNDGKKNSNKNYTNMEIEGEQQLQIVVPHASSGDTEEYDGISPSTQGSNTNNTNSNINGRDGMMMESKKGSLLGNIVNKSRRSLIKSKAAKEQLQEANNAASIPSSQPLSAQGEYQPNDYNNNMNNMNNQMNPAADMSVTDCGYSVGEDTTMLYPTINRNRTNSKDNMSDWDGYSMDGMSAIGDGGVSQYGGSGKGGGGSGVHSKNKGGGESRDMYYSGDVPRDFDSVWGDDESKLTMDGTDVNSVDYTDNGAARAALMAAADGDSISDYNMPPVVATSSRNNNADLADLTQNLNQLVDQELGVTDDVESVEKSNTSSAGKLDEFIDSDSASGSGHNFTLELLGKKSKSKLSKGTSGGSSSVTPSVDDDDSILGDLYKDDTMSELGGGLGGDDISAIEGVAEEDEDDDDDEGGGTDGKNASSGDSVDSTPSWAEKIQSAVGNSTVVSNIFRTSSKGMLDNDDAEDKMDTPAPSKDEVDDDESSSSSQAQRIKNKFMSGLISDDSSVGSSRSNRSRNSTSSKGSRGSHKSSSSRKANTAKSSSEKALGLTNSMDEEVDEDPAAMIDNINSMLSECRDILDTEKDTVGEP